MARFIYLAGPECGVDALTMFGVSFRKGYPSEVTDALAVRKLRGNRFFIEVEAGEVSDPPEPQKRGRGRLRKEA